MAAAVTSGDEQRAADVLPVVATTPPAETTPASIVEPVEQADTRAVQTKKRSSSASSTWTERAVRASRTAAKAVRSGKAYELSYDDGEWKVDVVGRGNRTTEFEINRNGTRILDRDNDDDGNDSDARRARSAKVSMAAAIRTAHKRGTGRIDDVEIERRNGTTTWKVSYEAGGADDVDVYVSTKSGKVVAVDRDDDNDDDDDDDNDDD